MNILFPYTLTSSLGGLQFPKFDLLGVPAGANVNQYLSSSDWNTTQQALVETGLAITTGSLFGLQRFLTAPTGSAGPNGNFADFIWLSSSGDLMQHLRTGVDRFLSGSVVGGGGPAPSGTLGGGAGTAGSWTISGSDSGHLLTIAVGTAPNAGDVIITGTFGTAFDAAPNEIGITPANAAAARAMSGVFVDATYVYNHAGTGYALVNTGAALTPSTVFKFFIGAVG